MSHISIRGISYLLLGAWNTVLAIGILFFIVRYKLEITEFFPSAVDLVDLQKIAAFVIARWEILLLSAVFFARFIPLTNDGRKWISIGESCFSNRAIPTRFKLVRWRWIILWVILCNMILFIALPWFSDNIAVFCTLFAIQHVNSALWIVAMRRNVRFYFLDERYQPPDADINKVFIMQRRDVVSRFIHYPYNVSREVATSIAFATAFSVTLTDTFFYAAPYIIALTAQTLNEYLAYRERKERDVGLANIEREQYSPPPDEGSMENEKG